ncbi:MAG: glycosyltransferase family 4 protein [Thermaerobacter sp.]|nr:glycosyltransferase family 4 protein [Thermaerobacter sp.]
MEIGLIVPAGTPPTGGNRITAFRLEGTLKANGVHAEVYEYGDPLPRLDVYHAFNAVQVGMRLIQDGISAARIVSTWTGTDLWQDWAADARVIRRELAAVSNHVVFTADARGRLLQEAPDWESRVVVVPPAVDTAVFHPGVDSIRTPYPFVLLAGGVRPVKRSAWAVELVENLRTTQPDIHLVIAGPVRDVEEAERVRAAADGRPWVHLVGEIDKNEMPRWYRSAALVINTSRIEGLSNALMEALASGALVLASDIAGNRAIVTDGENGALFAGEDEFCLKAETLLKGGPKVEAMRRAARDHMVRSHSMGVECQQYMRLYQEILALGGCRR